MCFTLAGTVAATCIIGMAGIANAENLASAWSKAYQSNPSIAAERARVRSIDEGVPQARSGWRPTVSVTNSTGLQYVDQELSQGGSGDDTIFPTTITGRVSQPLYRGGRTGADTSRADSEVRAARAGLTNVEQQVLFSVGQAYMDVLRDKAVVDLNINNINVLERQLQATQDRFSVGEVTRTDVAQAESRLARSKADLTTAEGNLQTSRAAYARQVGEPPDNLEPPTTPYGVPSSLDDAVQRAAANNPAVIQALSLHQSAKHTVDLVEGELSPTVALNGLLQQSFNSSRNVDQTTVAQATVDLTVPLYQSGSVYSRVRSAKQAESQHLQLAEDNRRQAVEAATQGWEQLVATRARIDSLESEIRANEIALEGVQQEALVGTRTVLDILDAEQELLDARVNLVVARRDEYVAVFNLLAAVGSMTAEGLQLDAPRYDPSVYYRSVRDKWFGTSVR
jgi:outer membrane protein